MPGILGTTQATGVSKTANAMTDRGARATAIAQNISNNTSVGQARDLLTGMRDTLRAQNNGDETLLRLVHTTKTDQRMAFQSLNKKWGNSTRTLETKAALIAEFEKAGWDTTDLKAYLDPKTTRADRIRANEILRILENASTKAGTEGPDFRFNANETTNPWPEENTLRAPELGSGAFGSVQKMKFNGEPMAVKTLGAQNFQPVILDRLRGPHINRDKEVTAAFLKDDTNSVIQPKYFLVRVKQGDQEQQLMIKGGKEFKEWAKSQLWEPQTYDEDLGDYQPARQRANAPEIKITGLVMPLAQGTTLDTAVVNGVVNFSQTATSAMESLKQLARHGFVHGDIKPANLVSTTGGDLKLIDTGSMAKITKEAVNRPLPLPSDSLDKSTRPTTPHFTHPGHPPDFKKVGMEQDLFSMGVTLLETKLLNITKTLGPDEADDFKYAANQILDTIKKENDAPNAHSADTIRSEIQTQLEDLKSNYSQVFADGELDWAEGVVNTALAQTKPVVDREGWEGVLNNLQLP